MAPVWAGTGGREEDRLREKNAVATRDGSEISPGVIQASYGIPQMTDQNIGRRLEGAMLPLIPVLRHSGVLESERLGGYSGTRQILGYRVQIFWFS